MNYKAYFDGSCFLSDCGIGYVVRDPEGLPVCEVAEYVGRGSRTARSKSRISGSRVSDTLMTILVGG